MGSKIFNLALSGWMSLAFLVPVYGQTQVADPVTLEGGAPNASTEVRGYAKIKKIPRIDSYYPRSMKNRNIAGAASIVRVCVDSMGKIDGEPNLITSSFNDDFDKATIALAKDGQYEAGTVDGVARPGCVIFKVTGEYKLEATSTQIAAVNALREQLGKVVPRIEGDVEYESVTSDGATLTFNKKLWKKDFSGSSRAELEELFKRTTEQETSFYCNIKSIRQGFKSGVSIVTWYKTSGGGTIFGIVTNDESCNARRY